MYDGSGTPAAPTMNTIRILVLSLLMGMVSFMLVCMFLNTKNGPSATGAAGGASPDVMFMALGAVAVFATIVFFIAPKLTLRGIAPKWHDAQTEDERERFVMTGLMTTTIFRAAPVEGTGLFGTVIFMLYGEWAALAAPALASIILLALVPTRGEKEKIQRHLEQFFR